MHGVFDEVGDDLPDEHRVAEDRHSVLAGVKFQIDVLGVRAAQPAQTHLTRDNAKVDLLKLQVDARLWVGAGHGEQLL